MIIELLYHGICFLFGLLCFFMNVTVGRSAILDLIVKTIWKIASLFVILYAGVVFFKHFQII